MASIDRDAFERDGFLLLRRLLAPEDLAPVLRVILEAAGRLIDDLCEQGRLPSRFGDDPMVARWQQAVAALGGEHERRSWDADVVTPELHALMAHPRVLDVVESVIGGEIEATGMIAVRPKIPNDKRTTVLWHQDSNYFGEQTAAQRIISVWFPLVPADAHNGCMQVIPSTHISGVREHGKAAQAGNLLSINQEVGVSREQAETAVDLPLRAGQVSIHDGTLIHGSLPNRSDRRRALEDLIVERLLASNVEGSLAERIRDPVASTMSLKLTNRACPSAVLMTADVSPVRHRFPATMSTPA